MQSKNELSTIMFPPIGSVCHVSDFAEDMETSIEEYTIADPDNKNVRSVRVNVFDILNVNGFSKLLPMDIEYWGSDAGTGENKMLANLYGFRKDIDESDETIIERIPAEFDTEGHFTSFTVSGYEYVMLVPKANWRNSVSFAPSRIRPLSYLVLCETE